MPTTCRYHSELTCPKSETELGTETECMLCILGKIKDYSCDMVGLIEAKYKKEEYSILQNAKETGRCSHLKDRTCLKHDVPKNTIQCLRCLLLHITRTGDSIQAILQRKKEIEEKENA